MQWQQLSLEEKGGDVCTNYPKQPFSSQEYKLRQEKKKKKKLPCASMYILKARQLFNCKQLNNCGCLVNNFCKVNLYLWKFSMVLMSQDNFHIRSETVLWSPSDPLSIKVQNTFLEVMY